MGRAGRDGGRYDDISPATETVIAIAPDASVAQVGDAIAAARRAFDDGPWATMSAGRIAPAASTSSARR